VSSKDTIQSIRRQCLHPSINATKVVRRGMEIVEKVGATFWMESQDISEFKDFDKEELTPYFNMFLPQVPSLCKEFERDKFSRRLLIQFPREYHYNQNENMVPCMESILLLFDEDYSHQAVVNIRSSDITRLSCDLGIINHLIYQLTENHFKIKSSTKKMFIQIGSLHEYTNVDKKEGL